MMTCVSTPRVSISPRALTAPCINRRTQHVSVTRVKASTEDKSETSKSQGEEDLADWQKPMSASQFFGSYLQFGVWAVVLSYAAYTGYQKAQVSPEEVGMLLAPPGAALGLTAAFLLYRFTVGKSEFEN